MIFRPHINNSTVDIECETNRFRNEDIVHLYMRALDLARAAVDLVGFAQGIGLTVFLDTLIKPDGTSSPLLFNNDRLSALCTSYRVNATNAQEGAAFHEVYRLVSSEPGLFMALNDLIVAITIPHQAPINCSRAIEGLRHLVAPGASTKDSWAALRANLQLSEEYLKFVTDWSTGPRHGDRTYISGEITSEVTSRSWIVMNRFLEFRKRRNQPLPPLEFPALTA